MAYGPLLGSDDPEPVEIVNLSGASPFLLVGDHAGRLIPQRLRRLGLGSPDLNRHIASDLGVRPLLLGLSTALDACLVMQPYSRLVIDCNRDPSRADAIPEVSDGTAIPGNMHLGQEERHERVAAIHQSYHKAITHILDRRLARQTIFLAVHSFTPHLGGQERPWDIGVMHAGHADGYAKALLAKLRTVPQLCVGDNQPYQMDDTDFTVPLHTWRRGLLYAEIEVRQDLLIGPRQSEMAGLLGDALQAALLAMR